MGTKAQKPSQKQKQDIANETTTGPLLEDGYHSFQVDPPGAYVSYY